MAMFNSYIELSEGFRGYHDFDRFVDLFTDISQTLLGLFNCSLGMVVGTHDQSSHDGSDFVFTRAVITLETDSTCCPMVCEVG